ncbi:creatininase family protein [Algoriphagus boritolerans]|uniref:creatininase family protein n=1 Tax=Algoriphagus boritolerans TaxID=308111 RepID=UPI000AB45EA2
MKSLFSVCLILLSFSSIFAQQKISTREMDRINWMEFAEFVPEKNYYGSLTCRHTGATRRHQQRCGQHRSFCHAMDIAEELNAMVAPTLNYGITGSMAAFPGAFQISEEAYIPFIRDILKGLAKNKFKNIIILNGHGGRQTAVLQKVAAEVAHELGVRTLVINWWSFASDVTLEVFKEDGGHAGLNETAYIQAIDPTLVHKERYNPDQATANPKPNTWSAVPFPSSIGLYQEGQGYPNFNQAQADEYFRKVNAKVAELIKETIRKWDLAGL